MLPPPLLPLRPHQRALTALIVLKKSSTILLRKCRREEAGGSPGLRLAFNIQTLAQRRSLWPGKQRRRIWALQRSERKTDRHHISWEMQIMGKGTFWKLVHEAQEPKTTKSIKLASFPKYDKHVFIVLFLWDNGICRFVYQKQYNRRPTFVFYLTAITPSLRCVTVRSFRVTAVTIEAESYSGFFKSFDGYNVLKLWGKTFHLFPKYIIRRFPTCRYLRQQCQIGSSDRILKVDLTLSYSKNYVMHHPTKRCKAHVL